MRNPDEKPTNAVFAQVDDEVLSRIQASPSLGEMLFMDRSVLDQPAGAPSLTEIFKGLEDTARSAPPEALAAALSLVTPELRPQIEASIRRSFIRAVSPFDVFLKSLEPFEAQGRQLLKSVVPRAMLKVDKAWHGVHYVLCGEAERGEALLSQAVLGGVELGGAEGCDPDEIWGEGPARYFTVARVEELAVALSGAEVESEAAGRFDAARMEQLGIYPGWRDSDKQRVMGAFRWLRDFYADAAVNGCAMVTCLT
jgi:hypothetical protein